MPRAGPSRRGASQSQQTHSQSQRAQNGIAYEDDDDAEMQDSELESHQEERSNDENTLTRKANDLVRLALFAEHRRSPLKREEIVKKVLGSNTRMFKTVLEEAQHILRKTFGMELVELRSQAELDRSVHQNVDEEAEEARNGTGIKKRASAAGPKTYILRSTLDPTIIEYAALTDERILEEEIINDPDDYDNGNQFGTRSYGSIISWSRSDRLGLVGLLYVVLALILVSGRVMNEGDLRANLKRLGLHPSVTLSFTPQSTEKPQSVDTYLTHLIRQGYLDRQNMTDKAAGAKRGRSSRANVSTQGDREDTGTWEWRWGNRAQSEVGEKGVANFMAQFMVEELGGHEADEDEDERPGTSKKGKDKGRANHVEKAERRMETMMKGIERAAGGHLADIQ